jgi:hypothetical protein
VNVLTYFTNSRHWSPSPELPPSWPSDLGESPSLPSLKIDPPCRPDAPRALPSIPRHRSSGWPCPMASPLPCVGVPAREPTSPSEIFFYFDIFNQYSTNEPSQQFSPNLALLSCANASGMTYEGATPMHMLWLSSTWTPVATSMQPVPPYLSVPKMSHSILNGMTLLWVTTPFWAWLILGQNQPSLFSLPFTIFYK